MFKEPGEYVCEAISATGILADLHFRKLLTGKLWAVCRRCVVVFCCARKLWAAESVAAGQVGDEDLTHACLDGVDGGLL